MPGVRRDPVAAQGCRPVKVIVEADGGSRGNPGPAGYGAVVWSADRSIVLAESKQAIGQATNNVAEYRGLIAGLEEAAKLGATEVAVSMDSKLVVEQMSGRWKVKHPDLAELHAQARALARGSTGSPTAGSRGPRTPTPTGWPTRRWMPRPTLGGGPPTQRRRPPSARSRRPPGWTGARGAATRLLLLRHGQTELSVQRRYSGRGNPALTDLGRQQADAAAGYLAARGGIAAVISSPLQRCQRHRGGGRQTAGPRRRGRRRPDRDRFRRVGRADVRRGRRTRSRTAPPVAARHQHRAARTGKASIDVSQRVPRARDRIVAEHGGSTVLVVSHVTPIKMLLREALDAGPGILYRLHLDLASLSIAEFYPDGASSVRLVNQTGYLG